jgi:HEAT repeat protein
LLERVVDSPEAPAGLRSALLSELARRGFVDGTPHWLRLLRTTSKPELLQVIRAAGQHPSAAVDEALIDMLGGKDPEVAAAAALALAPPAHADATPSLAASLDHPESRVRMAAIRALGRIPTPAARSALETAAAEPGEPETRRRAAAEVRAASR